MQTKAISPDRHRPQPSAGNPALARRAASQGMARHLPGRCACGGGCPRCAATASTVLSSQDHENEADRVAQFAVQGAPSVAASAGAQRIPLNLQRHFQTRLGHDLSAVKISVGASAADQAQRQGADAFTRANEISFAPGQFAPHTPAGRLLLAHELSHVVQQGAAPPLPAVAQPPLRGSARAAAVQLQPAKLLGGSWFDRIPAVKKLIQDNDRSAGQEIWKLLEANDMKGTPTVLRTALIDGEQHEWQLTVRADWLDRGSLHPGTKYGETEKTVLHTRDSDKVQVHEIPIKVNKLLKSTDEDETKFPKGQNASDEARVNFMAARTLYHEMHHALIRLQEEIAPAAPGPAAAGFAAMVTKLDTSPKLMAAKQAVMTTTSLMVFAAERFIGVSNLFAAPGTTPKTRADLIREQAAADGLDKKILPGLEAAIKNNIPFANKSQEHVNFLRETVTMFIEEKYARQTTGYAFKLKAYQQNAGLVADYVPRVDEALTKLAVALRAGRPIDLTLNPAYARTFAALRGNVASMLDLLDTEPQPTPGTLPVQPAGEMPAPLGMNGKPIRK